MDIALERKDRPAWLPCLIETTGPKSQLRPANSLALNPSGAFLTVRQDDFTLGTCWQFEDLTATGVDATFQILASLFAADMVTTHPYLTCTQLTQRLISPRNQQTLTLLAIEQAVVAEYAAVPQVALIYSDRYLDEHVFTLFVTGDQYDDAVMDTLLDHEIALLKRFALGPLTFHYIPYSSNMPRRDMVRETARLIFED